MVPPFASFYHYEPTAEETIGFDIPKANQILDDAGVMPIPMATEYETIRRQGTDLQIPVHPSLRVRHRRPAG